MQKIYFKYLTNNYEKLFVSRSSELLYKNSLDTHRLKLHNTKSIIEELISVCQSANIGLLTNNEYASSTASELLSMLDEESENIIFNRINRDYFKEILKQTKKENYNRIIQASKIILEDNRDYLDNLFDKIHTIVSSNYITDDKIISKNSKNLSILTNYLFIELVNKGFSKQYLYYVFQVIFIYKDYENFCFCERFSKWKELCYREKEKFTVIYSIISTDFQILELKKINNSYIQINSKWRKAISKITSERVNVFLEENKMNKLVGIEVNALDYYKALEISRELLSRDLDLYHLGLNSHYFEIDKQAAVIGDNEPEKSSTIPSNFQIDGHLNSSIKVYDKLLKKIHKIKDNNIDGESLDKLYSAIRYLRTGSQSPELETKLLNYWIGLEYIFTSSMSEEKTIDRIKKYYPICHALVYVKRNLIDFHRSIVRNDLSHLFSDFNHDLKYLTQFNNYKLIVENSDNELMKFRALFFQNWIDSPGNITQSLNRHKSNLNWNIIRLYRIRNEIVHNAAIKNGIYSNISHMKYYLTFILNSILDFMSKDAIDLDNDGKITIEDYFIAQDIMYGSLKNNTIHNYLKVRTTSNII